MHRKPGTPERLEMQRRLERSVRAEIKLRWQAIAHRRTPQAALSSQAVWVRRSFSFEGIRCSLVSVVQIDREGLPKCFTLKHHSLFEQPLLKFLR
jgi:hypothetical protein